MRNLKICSQCAMFDVERLDIYMSKAFRCNVQTNEDDYFHKEEFVKLELPEHCRNKLEQVVLEQNKDLFL